MKIAIIGRGKTGQSVIDLLDPQEISGPYGKENFPSAKEISECNAAIVFVPGPAFLEILPVLIEANIPVVVGATGFVWPRDLHQSLLNRNVAWIYASNFSIGMNMMLLLCDQLNAMAPALEEAQLQIEEVHHTKKIDAPSGSALSIKDRFSKSVAINSIREGDVVGIHQLTLSSKNETLSIRHEAKDRKLFAEGAIWSAKYLVNTSSVPAGLHNFTDLLAKKFIKGGSQ